MILLTNEAIKEDLSICYLKAITACNGIALEKPDHDYDSEDVYIKKTMNLDNESFVSELRFQLKATSSDSVYSENNEYISYKLKVKNYNDLCTPAVVPIVLGLLILPGDQSEWVNCTESELILKGRMYWLSLMNRDISNKKSNVTVKIPKSNILNEKTIESLLITIAKGEDL